MAHVIEKLETTDLGSRQMLDAPHARLAYLRKHQPVSWAVAKGLLQGKGGYLLTRYDDVMLIHSDDRFSTDMLRNSPAGKFIWLVPPSLRMLAETMVFKDDPDHKRLRTLVHKAFTPKYVATLAPDITAIAERLADEVAARREVDLVHEYAVRVPLSVIATMLGVPDSERDRFHYLALPSW